MLVCCGYNILQTTDPKQKAKIQQKRNQQNAKIDQIKQEMNGNRGSKSSRGGKRGGKRGGGTRGGKS